MVSEEQIQDISVMQDYDMLASGNYARFIYDGNGDEHGFAGPNGSGVLEQVYKDWYDSQGLAYETIPFDGRSDYGVHESRNPGRRHLRRRRGRQDCGALQLYGGTAGQPFDPCYHQLCDMLANISRQGLKEHKDAAVHAILTFVQTNSSIHGTDQARGRRQRPRTGRATSWSARPSPQK
jgi:hypothetical protein